ncbi:MAG: sporulation protein YqfD [Ruminococcaceae bacterium]|nr:sporulation protein YqfD [Oscillospiraceae bacterium]
MFVKLLNFLRGYVLLAVRGFFVERFLNLCLKKDIFLWDLNYLDENNINLKMSIKGFKMVRSAAYKTRSKVKVLKKAGLPFIIQKYKKRKGFVVGFACAVFVFLFLSSFVWRIDVEGNKKIESEILIRQLNECGFKNGNLRYGVDVYYLQNEMMKKNKDLAWFWLEIKGTRATIKVKERVEAPQMIDKTIPANVVAAKKGLITKVVALSGDSVVKEGDVVDDGDLLISGIVDLGEKGFKTVNARGNVIARTWYSVEDEFELIKTEYKKTDKKISKNTVNFFGFDVSLYISDKIPYKNFDVEKKEKQFSMGKNFYLPVKITENTYYEKIKIETKLTEDGCLVYYGDVLKKRLEKSLDKDVKIVNKNIEHKMKENGKIFIKVVYECIEDISKTVKIENGG